MRTLKAFIFILFFCSSFSTLTAQECLTNVKKIVLTCYPIRPVDCTGSTSEEGLPIKRNIQRQLVEAYLYNDMVNISFNENIEAVTVIVTNESIGETIYSETHSSPTTLNIDLSSANSGNYRIEIETDDTCLEGNFSL